MNLLAYFLLLIPVCIQFFYVIQKIRKKVQRSIALTTIISLILAIICSIIALDIFHRVDANQLLWCGPPPILGLAILSIGFIVIIAVFGFLLDE